jgi:hypothetical protein
MTHETLDPQSPKEPASDVPESAAANGAGSPSSVQQHEIALDLEWTHLKEELPKAEAAKKAADAHLKRVRLELEAARQLVAHHRRLRSRLAK